MPSSAATAPVPRPVTDRAVLRRGLRVIGGGMAAQRGPVAVAVVGSVLWAGATVATAWAIGWLTDEVVEPSVQARQVEAAGLWTIFGVLAGVLLVNVLGVILRRVWATVAGFNLQADYRRRVTRQYLRLPLSWHHAHPSGQLLSRAHADVEATWQVFNPLPMAIGVIFMLVIAGTMMVLVDPLLAVLGLLVFPGLFAANLVFQRVMSPRITRAQQLRAEVAEVAHESFEAGLVVKAMGREDQETERFRSKAYELRDSLILVGRTRGVFEPVIEAIPTLGTLAVLGVGTWQVSRGALDAADVVQMAYLFSILAFPVRALGWVLAEIPRSVVGHDRVQHVLRAGGGMPYGSATLPARERPAESVLRGVTYAHAGEERPTIRGVTLEAPQGSTVALVGPTGSGKSTLTNLALRLVDADDGSVRLDGVEARELAHGELPASASLVAQQTFMFDDSVRGNITLGEEADDASVWESLRIAQADDFVRSLPQGLDTVIGERGGSLSGGQRQRIALARAIWRHPRLLVLDDATSAVDPSVEQAILAGLREARGGMTVLVVAYRMATILLADEVVYLEHGRVVDQGSHAELLGRCRGYVDLVQAYSREAAERAALTRQEEVAP
ncbi:ABC-type multidrug transport system ATPase and permease components [Serinicoccus hydrothermalis]|uniref:ABC-type multidrug transport system ATPase and permease components n=1 Tax=Serinicoccus hydrothermalis TaxID=1758689 RepID=A0A1B1N854_9MICO|nr:ABC transporter ATP-binding protein [Serinicoccus hydrothermalis]ANS77610.1 ABC-type multidrug transport system ATPase and permease components [Serinicoccus hydrothermalis]